MLSKDIRFAIRMLVKYPGHTLVSTIVLSLGIGLTATIFSVVHGTFLRELPFYNAHQLVRLGCSNISAGMTSLPVRPHDYFDWRAHQTSFEGVAAWAGASLIVSGPAGAAERKNGAYISANLFDLLGVNTAIGRTFEDHDTEVQAEPAVILSDKIWRQRFSGDSQILGSQIRINSEAMVVVGVMPPGFAFPLSQELWLPLRIDIDTIDRGRGMRLQVFGRLRDTTSLSRARAEMSGIAERLANEFPESNKGIGAVVDRYLDAYSDNEMRSYLYTILGAAFAILLVACANVANLLLARSTLRSHELAIRGSLGATRFRLVIQLLTESGILSILGGGLGLGIAAGGSHLTNNVISPMLRSFWIDIRLDPQVFLFVVVTTLLSGAISGVLPALNASGPRMIDILKNQSCRFASPRAGNFMRFLVVFEITLSCALLIVTGMMVLSIVNLASANYGFATADVLIGQLSLEGTKYESSHSLRGFYAEILRRLEVVSGVRAVALTSNVPGDRSAYRMPFTVEGRIHSTDTQHPTAQVISVTPDYFNTFSVSPTQGRTFTASDNEDGQQVAIVTESYADHYLGSPPYIGQRFRLGEGDPGQSWITVVGIVPDALLGAEIPRQASGSLAIVVAPLGKDREGIFLPIAQSTRRWFSVVVRSEGSPLSLTGAVRNQIDAIDSDLPIFWVRTMKADIADALWVNRFLSKTFISFGIIAFLLALIGLYAVMAESVSRRMQELGLRMALGAQARELFTLILKGGLIQLSVGVLLGLTLAASFSAILTNFLYRVTSWNYLICTLVCVSVILIGIIACIVPAFRAMRVDPLAAIRYE